MKHIGQLFCVVTALLSACAVGPDFKQPSVPGPNAYLPQNAPTQAPETTAPQFEDGRMVPERWWEAFQCQELSELVGESLQRSPSALEARARLRQAQETYTAQSRAIEYPSVDAQVGITRQKLDPAAFGFPGVPPAPPFTLYNAQLNVFYTLDLFGADRRTVEGHAARRDHQMYETSAAELTLAANVVVAVIRRADLQSQVDLTEQMVTAESRQYAIDQERYAVGGISLADLQNRSAQVEGLRSTLAPLKAQRDQLDHQLAVYLGRTPGEGEIPAIVLSQLHMPAPIPVTLPADLVRRRPDVQAYEAQWHEASADVGVATANLFPTITISGYAGSDRTNASDIVDSFNVWSIGAKLVQPLFHAGELRAQKRSAVAAYDAAAQAYREAVLEAFQQVADGLRAVQAGEMQLQARSLAHERYDQNYSIARQRFEAGGISESTLLDAQRSKLQGDLDQNRAAAQQLSDAAALLHAMAGPV
ncbi:MAG TPA: efflux transporter outer membrane subunit [Steroidobacteraceae bacterium]|jgi:NodT family efflux transporter outer membrane factor (OMF) lipoprotein